MPNEPEPSPDLQRARQASRGLGEWSWGGQRPPSAGRSLSLCGSVSPLSDEVTSESLQLCDWAQLSQHSLPQGHTKEATLFYKLGKMLHQS